jgi:hypothetical protein
VLFLGQGVQRVEMGEKCYWAHGVGVFLKQVKVLGNAGNGTGRNVGQHIF